MISTNIDGCYYTLSIDLSSTTQKKWIIPIGKGTRMKGYFLRKWNNYCGAVSMGRWTLKFGSKPPLHDGNLTLSNFYVYLNLLHITCGYHCDKAVNKNDTRQVIWYQFTEWHNIISLHGFELSNQIHCNNLVGPIGLHVIF